MKQQVLLDTGPLVAALMRRDQYHPWSKLLWKEIQPPLLTCESVLSEACFLLARASQSTEAIFELVRRGVVQVTLSMQDEVDAIAQLMRRYRDVPMSLADAGLVRLAEIHTGGSVFTLDSHFRRYRKHGRQVIPLITPDDVV